MYSIFCADSVAWYWCMNFVVLSFKAWWVAMGCLCNPYKAQLMACSAWAACSHITLGFLLYPTIFSQVCQASQACLFRVRTSSLSPSSLFILLLWGSGTLLCNKDFSGIFGPISQSSNCPAILFVCVCVCLISVSQKFIPGWCPTRFFFCFVCLFF